MPAGLDLTLLACRITLSPRRPLRFPVPASNTLRGALGYHLPAQWFRPSNGNGPSGLRDRPRPFVLRAAALDGAEIPACQPFQFDLNLFAPEALEPFYDALLAVCREGITAERVRLDPLDWQYEELNLDLSARTVVPESLRVRFLTPTELKGYGDERTAPPFDILLARLRDRVSALRSFYGSGPLDIDHAALGERAGAVTLAGSHLEIVNARRRSAFTHQSHPLSGFAGWADYTGPFGEFLPFLEAGHWTGVGRQTVWGKGWISVEAPK